MDTQELREAFHFSGVCPSAYLSRATDKWFNECVSRHIQRCRILVHVVNGDSPDPVGDYKAINQVLHPLHHHSIKIRLSALEGSRSWYHNWMCMGPQM